MKSGMISGGDWFERVNPSLVYVMSCDLVFMVDTKGFYQPVYEIGLESPEAGYSAVVHIPAIK